MFVVLRCIWIFNLLLNLGNIVKLYEKYCRCENITFLKLYFISFHSPVHPCDKPSNGGCEHVCNKKGDSVVCSCNEGYKLDGNGASCTKG